MISAITSGIRRLGRRWDRFFHEKADLSICGEIRIAYAFLLLVNALVLLPDLEKWFGESGLVPLSASRTIIDPDTVTLFQWLPQTNVVLWTCYTLFLVQIVALLFGVFTRFQLVSVFVWLVSFQHRHVILFDGEDVVFRLLCFFLIFTPAGKYYSLDRWRKNRSGRGDDEAVGTPVWPLRLIQIQMSLIYISSVWEKLKGKDWLDGTALYYVSRLDDLFGRFWVPDFMFESMPGASFVRFDPQNKEGRLRARYPSQSRESGVKSISPTGCGSTPSPCRDPDGSGSTRRDS